MSVARPRSLYDAFAQVADPRGARGKRHPLQAVLSMSVAAMLSGCQSLSAIAQWGREVVKPDRSFFLRFGFTSFTSPAVSTLHEIFKAIDVETFERVLSAWVQNLLGKSPAAKGPCAVSIDGKTLRGSQRRQDDVPGVHLIAAYLQDPGCALAQRRVSEKTNEPKAALGLIEQLVLRETVIVGDAIYCQRELAEAVTAKKGDYFFVVKENQPELKAAIEGAFEAPLSPPRTPAMASGNPIVPAG